MKSKRSSLRLALACGLSFLAACRPSAAPAEPPTKTPAPKRADSDSALTRGISGGSRFSTGHEVLSSDNMFLTHGLLLFLRPQKAQFSATEPVMLDLLLFNQRSKTPSFNESGYLLSEADGRVQIKDEQEQDVPLTAFGKDNYALPKPPPGLLPNIFHSGGHGVEIPSGKYVTYHFYLNRLFDMSRSGAYTVTMSKTLPNTAGTGGVSLTSNTASIVIREPEPPYDLLYESNFPSPLGQFQQKF